MGSVGFQKTPVDIGSATKQSVALFMLLYLFSEESSVVWLKSMLSWLVDPVTLLALSEFWVRTKRTVYNGRSQGGTFDLETSAIASVPH